MPFLAVFTAAPKIGHHEDASLVNPDTPREIKTRRHADAEAAVTTENHRRLAVEPRALAADDVERNFRPILGHGVPADHLHISKISRRSSFQLGRGRAFFGFVRIVALPGVGLCKTNRANEDFIATPANHLL